MAGLSLRELAKRAGTSHSTLIAYENGTKSPSLDTFYRIVEACDLSIEIQYAPRIRHTHGRSKGDELIDVLKLASHFPSRARRLPPPLNVTHLMATRGERSTT